MRHILWCEGLWSETNLAASTHLRITWLPLGVAKRFLIFSHARWLADSEGHVLRITVHLDNGISSGFGDFRKNVIDLFSPLALNSFQWRSKWRQWNYKVMVLWGSRREIKSTVIGTVFSKLNSIKPLAAFTDGNKRCRERALENERVVSVRSYEHCHAAVRISHPGFKTFTRV
jgi:hypothetical protein